jgi:hypothetical protein
MGKTNISPDNRSPHDLLLDDLLVALGVGASETFWFILELEKIESAWLARREVPNVGQYRKELRRYRAITAKRRELREQFPPFVREAIEMAAWLRANPNVEEIELRALLQDPRYIDPAAIGKISEEEAEDRDIQFLINSTGDYRKRQVRKLVVEPFLLLLKEFGVVSHPKRLPLSRMMHAFFDWLGIEQALRPTDSGIRTIERDLRKRDQRD